MSKPVAHIRPQEQPQLTERELMKLLLDLEQRVLACEQLLGLTEERPRLKLVKGHRQ